MTIGVLGGGQLGRMLALAGAPLGQRFLFLDPSRSACAGHVGEQIVGAYDDEEKLSDLARRSSVVTFEFENVALSAARYLAELVAVYPPPLALELSQDRLVEKRLFSLLDIPTPKFAEVSDEVTLAQAREAVGLPLVLKTRRFGYDGKGQAVVTSEQELEKAFVALGAAPLIAEERIAFDREVSLVSVRKADGELAFYSLFENVHAAGLLRFSRPISDPPLQALAESYAKRVLQRMNYVGTFTMEFFVRGSELLANEMAPRVHNSGHLTIEGHETSQFENHVRAIVGLPLGSTAQRGESAMFNLLSEPKDLVSLMRMPGVHVHRYGKEASRDPGAERKMGHVTICANDASALRARVHAVAEAAFPELLPRLPSIG